jgi:enolase-phosphatase E1
MFAAREHFRLLGCAKHSPKAKIKPMSCWRQLMALTEIDALLLDIEGTTTPVDFVFKVLFPFARDRLATFLQAEVQDPEVQADLALLKAEHTQDQAQGLVIPPWTGEPGDGVAYCQFLIDQDRKSTGLKSLQGKIWDQGYGDGSLRSQLFVDVKPAFERWVAAGKKLYIFSSGSVQAQKLLFGYTEVGDLTPFISGYFDTRTGPKREAESYRAIASQMNVPCDRILFISDIVAELAAARAAGMAVRLSQRPGNQPQESEGYIICQDLGQI